MNVSSGKERVNSPFCHLCVLFRPSVDWTVPTRTEEGGLLYSVHPFECWSLPEATDFPLPTPGEIIFSQLSGHPLAELNGHIKLTITVRVCLPD